MNIRIRLVGAEPPTGWIEVETPPRAGTAAQAGVRFVGWLGLLQALQQVAAAQPSGIARHWEDPPLPGGPERR